MLNYLLLFFSTLLFLCGIYLPMFSIEKFFVLQEVFSLLGGIYILFSSKEWFLATVLFVFSVLMPLFKMIVSWQMLTANSGDGEQKLHQANKLAAVSKWSMADVFLIALLASVLKFSGLFKVTLFAGFYCFAVSVCLAAILTHRLLANYHLIAKANDGV